MNENLKTWLEKQNITQAELAKRLGHSFEYVNRVVNGKMPITDAFRWRFAQAFGFDVAEQLFGDGGDADVSPSAQPAPAQERG